MVVFSKTKIFSLNSSGFYLRPRQARPMTLLIAWSQTNPDWDGLNVIESTYEEIARKFIIHIYLKEIWMALRILNLCFTHCVPWFKQHSSSTQKANNITKSSKKSDSNQRDLSVFIIIRWRTHHQFCGFQPAAAAERFGVFSPFTIVFMELLGD